MDAHRCQDWVTLIAATERPISASEHTARQHYNDHATALLANFAAIVRQGRLRGITDAIAHQMTTRRPSSRASG